MDLLIDHAEGNLAIVTLNRPAKRNAINLALWQALTTTIEHLGASRTIRGIILTGAGGNFSAGADIAEFATTHATPEAAAACEQIELDALHAVMNCPKPTVAQIAGYAIGGGCALALACDFRIADHTASLFIPAGRIGVVYNRLECELLLRQVGLSCAKGILFAGERMPAKQALSLGLLDELTDTDIAQAAQTFCRRFTAGAPLSAAGNKFVLNALARGQADALAAEIDHHVHHAMTSADHREGQAAFREKRPPIFAGE